MPRGVATRGVVRRKRIDSGGAATGLTLPPNSRRKRRADRAAWSIVAMCTNSWFMIVLSRSLAASVSNAKLSGAIWTVRRLRGTTVAAALPLSEKSTRRTVALPHRIQTTTLERE
jgi:hypothetical protein